MREEWVVKHQGELTLFQPPSASENHKTPQMIIVMVDACRRVDC